MTSVPETSDSTPDRSDACLTVWLVNAFDELPGDGTPPLRYWSLACALAANGHHVTWWTATWSHRRKTRRSTTTTNEGFAIRLVPVRPYRSNVSLARLFSHIDFGRHFEAEALAAVQSGELDKPDIILASLPPLEGPEAARRLAKRWHASFVVDVQDLWPETFERLLPGPQIVQRVAKRFLLSRMNARREQLVSAADGLVATTATYSNHVFASAPATTPQHVCFVGADVAGMRSPSAAQPARVPTPEVHCLYSGSLERGQDIDILPEVARILSRDNVHATIHIAGTGSREQKLKRESTNSTGTCRLKFHGLLAHAPYRELLASCQIGLVCVKPESFVVIPNKACDYAAAGLALVNSIPGELANLIDRHQAGLSYTAGSAASLAAAIKNLCEDRDRLRSMQNASVALAREELDRAATYPRFATWLEEIRQR
jgi:glycosyltransferase involved in cell wall biosynthesis